MEIIIIAVATIVFFVYEYRRAPFYDEETKRFYKNKKK
jgi:hypothetical protein